MCKNLKHVGMAIKLALFHETRMIQHLLDTCVEREERWVCSGSIAESLPDPLIDEEVICQHELVAFLHRLTFMSAVAYKRSPLGRGDVF